MPFEGVVSGNSISKETHEKYVGTVTIVLESNMPNITNLDKLVFKKIVDDESELCKISENQLNEFGVKKDGILRKIKILKTANLAYFVEISFESDWSDKLFFVGFKLGLASEAQSSVNEASYWFNEVRLMYK